MIETVQTLRSQIASEIKNLNFLLQSPKIKDQERSKILEQLKVITSELKEQI